MRFLLLTILIVICFSGCTSSSGTTKPVDTSSVAARLTEDDKHRLYSAALAASESPLDTDLFKDVCKKIGIFDANGNPNDKYMAFVAEHVDWGMKSETDLFRQEINSKEKAREYISRHFSR